MEHASIQLVSSPSKKWYRYRFATVLPLILTVAICGWTGLRVARAWKQSREVLAIRTIEGCRVIYDGETFFAKRHPESSISPSKKWPESLFGKDLFHRAGTVRLPANRVDEAMPHLKRLPYLRMVAVSRNESISKEEVGVAIKRIGQAIPELENIMVEFDFKLESGSQKTGVSVQKSVDGPFDFDQLHEFLLMLILHWW
jgi:hypothetical protein